MNIRYQQIANLSLLSAEIPDSFRFLPLSLPFLSLALFAILLSSHFLPPIPFIFPYSSHPTSLLFPRPFSYLRLLTFLISFHPPSSFRISPVPISFSGRGVVGTSSRSVSYTCSDWVFWLHCDVFVGKLLSTDGDDHRSYNDEMWHTCGHL